AAGLPHVAAAPRLAPRPPATPPCPGPGPPEPPPAPAAAGEPARPSHWRSVTGRAAALLAFWLVLTGVSVADLPIGAAATGLATWASLRLVPAGPVSLPPFASGRPPFCLFPPTHAVRPHLPP